MNRVKVGATEGEVSHGGLKRGKAEKKTGKAKNFMEVATPT